MKDTVSDEKWAAMLKRTTRLENGCLIWNGAKTPKGYGVVGFEKALFYVHRVACVRKHGPIGDLQALHECDTPSCMEGEHLFPGTPADNSEDMVAKGRSCVGEDCRNAKLTVADVREIRRSTLSLRLMAEKLGVSIGAIGHVRNGRTWRHVED